MVEKNRVEGGGGGVNAGRKKMKKKRKMKNEEGKVDYCIQSGVNFFCGYTVYKYTFQVNSSYVPLVHC